jgi:hypothetical protein
MSSFDATEHCRSRCRTAISDYMSRAAGRHWFMGANVGPRLLAGSLYLLKQDAVRTSQR